MSRNPSHTPRPSEIVMDELGEEQTPWDLDKHLKGCLAGYQTAPSYGAAVYFALEVLWGIAHDGEVRAATEKLDPDQLDPKWTIAPTTNLPVQWLWIRALAEAWSRYKHAGGPLGHAFGLEGGQGKSPIIDKLAQTLDELAIARWIGSQVQDARAAGKKIRIEDAVQDAAEKFNKSDVTIRRAWRRFARLERPHPK